jgi:hypothetical protein
MKKRHILEVHGGAQSSCERQVADSTIRTKDASYMAALRKMLMGGCMSVLIMKMLRPAALGGLLKDPCGEPERESEWGPIKILLEGDRGSNEMNTTSNTRLRLTT